MSVLLSDVEIQNMKKEAVSMALLEVLADVTECARQADSPIYQGDEVVDYSIRLSNVTDAINNYLN